METEYGQIFNTDPPPRDLRGRLVQEETRETKESVDSPDQKGPRVPGARLATWERRGGQGQLGAQEAMEYQGYQEQMADQA